MVTNMSGKGWRSTKKSTKHGNSKPCKKPQNRSDCSSLKNKKLQKQFLRREKKLASVSSNPRFIPSIHELPGGCSAGVLACEFTGRDACATGRFMESLQD